MSLDQTRLIVTYTMDGKWWACMPSMYLHWSADTRQEAIDLVVKDAEGMFRLHPDSVKEEWPRWSDYEFHFALLKGDYRAETQS